MDKIINLNKFDFLPHIVLDVGVEGYNYTPLSLNRIIDIIYKKEHH